MDLTHIRRIVAQVVWVICLVLAVALAAGALLIAVKANESNALVKAVLHVADAADVGLFDKDNGIKQWTGHNAEIKNALFNWGIGAIAWLIIGRVLERVIRPVASGRSTT